MIPYGEPEERFRAAIASAIMVERRLTSLEIAVNDMKGTHGQRLTHLEAEVRAREEAIWKAMRGLLLLALGAALDLRLNGGALLKALTGG